MTRTLTIYRVTYSVEDDGSGGSVAVELSTDATEYDCTGSTGEFHESPAREAAGYLRREGLSYGADGGDWFSHPEPCEHPYRNEYSETTGHLTGEWTDTEHRAVARMVEWLDREDLRRALEFSARLIS